MTFRIPHDRTTFLSPILDLIAGTERTFVYAPSGCNDSKYEGREMADLLVKQYPPLFHAATDIPSFVKALTIMSGLRLSLKISYKDQQPSHRYRRSVVDYALIERPTQPVITVTVRAPRRGALPTTIQDSAFLQHQQALGPNPLTDNPNDKFCPTDHLKFPHAYLGSFTSLQQLFFHWDGDRGLSPLSLATESSFSDAVKAKRGPVCPRHPEKLLRQPQFASLIQEHRLSLREFNYKNVVLHSGAWDDALAPLNRLRGSEGWKQRQDENVVDVPIVLSPVGISQKQLQRVTSALQQQKGTGTLRSLARARSETRELLAGRPDHMKRLLRSSVFWR
ncbi:hypothetical protein N7499_010373 [Penicillium canescens]|nr:hypothetical protein N7499_010373 [Penicillium canescens]